MDFKKVSLNIFKVIPMLLAFGILYSCENDMQEVAELTKEQLPVSTGKNVKLLYSENANIMVEVTAPLLEDYVGEKNFKEMREGIKTVFYDSLMNETSVLTSNYAIQYPEKRMMVVKDDVVIVNDKGEQLNTEHLTWLQDSAIIYSEEFVKITTNDEILMGKGFEASQDFSKWKIHEITGIINIDEEKKSSNNTP